MLIKAGAVIAVVIVAVLLFAASRPDSFRVERRVFIKAAPEKVFPYLEDPKKTTEWSPWEKKDPALKKTFSGATKGKGAVYEWEGNNEVGAGRLEITEVVPNAKVVMDLRFLRPMKAENTAAYAVAPKDGGCEVAWSIEGPMPFVSKVMFLFMDMDKMVGGEFEKGLADLKALAEAP
ncbi:MAG: SRPBCC family protein [Elusimicrobiota bacterium]|nr:SRPBCC family protein [Elusimicrobiota bacterium]